MTAYKKSAITAKEGINFIRSVVESGGSLFIKIEQENDLGIDAILEFIENEYPLNKQIAIQIKSGASYYTAKAKECAFPSGSHRTYWSRYPLPVFGLVYVPALQTAYWINIKHYLEQNPEAAVIRFPATEANKFNTATFNNLFVPAVIGKTPVLDFDEAFKLAHSQEASEIYLGLLVLFRRFPNKTAVWDELVRTFIERPTTEIPPVLLYWLAHIPGHGDIFYYGETPSAETRAYASGLFARFGVEEVIKLLSFIDPEEQIGRGTLGQSVEAIVSSLPNAATMLREIIRLHGVEMSIREFAALILAMNEGEGALADLAALEKEGSWYAGEMALHVKEYEWIKPYA
ncbi:MAG: DUF4365 domain-containing protein [Proteobacteria bacterium]|nr:DUF4365 domain-containing protein [Pseudomonadota bacterium]MBU4297312.1 DUF4365 domain-containing protein [Pseudomonadota bacterium]MCG2747746.1 DUF4365 domain-containing protein [Desulfobulbaceae bacterium]